MASSGMLRLVALVRATRRSIPEDAILHSHSHENLKSYLHDRNYSPIVVSSSLYYNARKSSVWPHTRRYEGKAIALCQWCR
jgi:hypothetical protein